MHQIRLDWELGELTDPLAGFEGPTSKRREGKGGEGKGGEGKPHYNVKEKGKGGEGKERKGDGWDGG